MYTPQVQTKLILVPCLMIVLGVKFDTIGNCNVQIKNLIGNNYDYNTKRSAH